MQSSSPKNRIRTLAIAGFVFMLILLAISQYAVQSFQSGDVDRGKSTISGTAFALLGLGAFAFMIGVSVHNVYLPVKRKALRLKRKFPESLLFMVSTPAHQTSNSMDNLNSPEVALPIAIATVFTADMEGLKWWTRGRRWEPDGLIPRSRIKSVRSSTPGEITHAQIVLELEGPSDTKRFTIMNDRSNGFNLYQQPDLSDLAKDIQEALGLRPD